jgi:hypothetical protein
MRYVTRVLQQGETIVYATTLHWFIYWRAILLLIICIALPGGVTVQGRQSESQSRPEDRSGHFRAIGVVVRPSCVYPARDDRTGSDRSAGNL